MNRRILATAILALLLWLSGCTPSAQPIAPSPTASAAFTPTRTPFAPKTNTPIPPTDTPAPTPAASPTASLTPTPSLSPTPPLPARAQYRLDATLDFWQRTLTVAERITYPNHSGSTLKALVLNVEPAQWKSVFTLQSVRVNGKAAHGTLTATRWDLPLPSPLPPGGSVQLEIHYQLHLPYRNGSRIFGTDARQTNLVDWYPFIVPYDSKQGWLWHPPWPFGDHLVYPCADFDVTLALVHPVPGTQIAASVLPDANGHYRLQSARTFVFSLSPLFRTVSSQAAGITITSYYFDDIAAGGKVLPHYAAQAIAAYSRKYGILPRKHLAIVATDSPDGMEYTGLVFLSRAFYRSYDRNLLSNLISLGVHELSHQWWYDQVGNDQAINPWMDESLAVYSEWLFYQQNYPSIAPRWWDFRVNYFKPTGYVNRSIYDYLSFRPYVNATYLRGAMFLDALRRRIGDQAFFGFLHDYYTQMRGKIATPEDFFRILAAHTSANYQDILSAYFVSPP